MRIDLLSFSIAKQALVSCVLARQTGKSGLYFINIELYSKKSAIKMQVNLENRKKLAKNVISMEQPHFKAMNTRTRKVRWQKENKAGQRWHEFKGR